jgi:hypothetical protein
MKLIRSHKGDYINVEKIESYSIHKTIASCNLDVIYEVVAYANDDGCYVIARFETERRAKDCLTELVRWLARDDNYCNVFVRDGDAK